MSAALRVVKDVPSSADAIIRELDAAVEAGLASDEQILDVWSRACDEWLRADDRKAWQDRVGASLGRRKMGAELRRSLRWVDGMSQQARAEMLGVSQYTVHTDREGIIGSNNPTHVPAPASNAGRPRKGHQPCAAPGEVQNLGPAAFAEPVQTTNKGDAIALCEQAVKLVQDMVECMIGEDLDFAESVLFSVETEIINQRGRIDNAREREASSG